MAFMRELVASRAVRQFLGYCLVGVLNTALNFFIINAAIVVTGIASGAWFLFFSFISFCIVTLHSFLWNRRLVFKSRNPERLHREYRLFILVTGTTLLLTLGLLHILVDIIGPQFSLGAHAWANVALLITIPFAVVCNFLSYKYIVFLEAQ